MRMYKKDTEIIEVKTGFSFTFFFFGLFVILYRMDWLALGHWLVLNVLLLILLISNPDIEPLMFIMGFILNVTWSTYYNENYEDYLLSKGYKLTKREIL